jgi:formylglycine-generating enzyme required for sulfatase activity
VSWNDAQAYIRWLNGETSGKDYRLPSEAEQEYAIRAGTTTAFVWGADENAGCGDGNGGDATLKAAVSSWPFPTPTCEDRFAYTAPVGTFRVNDFGLHDTVGNVWEWGQDCWIRDYKSVPSDQAARETECTSQSRVLRGGGWFFRPISLRSADRDSNSPDGRGSLLGFRLAQDR